MTSRGPDGKISPIPRHLPGFQFTLRNPACLKTFGKRTFSNPVTPRPPGVRIIMTADFRQELCRREPRRYISSATMADRDLQPGEFRVYLLKISMSNSTAFILLMNANRNIIGIIHLSSKLTLFFTNRIIVFFYAVLSESGIAESEVKEGGLILREFLIFPCFFARRKPFHVRKSVVLFFCRAGDAFPPAGRHGHRRE